MVGVIMLDTDFDRVVGDIGHPASFSYPVIYKKINGATVTRVVDQADPTLIEPFIAAAKELEAAGCEIIATSCGFLSIFHRQLQEAVSAQMLTSSLLQVKTASEIINADQKVAILTYKKSALNSNHFKGVDIDQLDKVVFGMDDCPYFSGYILGTQSLEFEKVADEMRSISKKIVTENDDIGAVVLECTNMPPYVDIVKEETGLPVYDILTLINSHYYDL